MSSSEINQKLNTAIQYHNAGRFPEAEVIYLQVINEDPINPSALNLFGLLLCQLGKHSEGLEHINKAVKISPTSYFYKSIANVYISLKQYDDAILHLNNAAKLDPMDSTIFFGIAIVHKNQKNLDKALDYYKQALEINPKYSAAYYNIANIYSDKKDFTNAIANYKLALELNPNDTDILVSLGSVYKEIKEIDTAIELLEKALAIKPNIEKAYISLGLLWAEKNNVDKALSYLQVGLEQNPNNPEIYFCIGNMFKKQGVKHFSSAIKYLTHAITLKPDYALAYNELGLVYFNMLNYEKAIELFTRGIELNPNHPVMYMNLGETYNMQKNKKKALEYFIEATKINPKFSPAYASIGLIYFEENNYNKALYFYKKGLKADINNDCLHLNIGNLYVDTRELDKALRHFKKAIKINPKLSAGYYNYATTLLLKGDFKKGWKYYEHRFGIKAKDEPTLPAFSQPIWNGSSIKGRTIYVYFDQAYGDSIQFARYLPVLSDMGAKVIFKTQSHLLSLFKESELESEIIDVAFPDDKVIFDTYISLLSIPLVLKTNDKNIPLSTGYLKADKEKVEEYRQKFFNNDKFKIGIKWIGNPRGLKSRIIELKYFLDLAKIPNTKIYSFQKGPGEEDLEEVPSNIEITNLGPTFKDFGDTAAALENVDLFICNDTSLAHLGGALGKQTWVLIPKAPEWRWMLDREDTPWYDSVKLFRQKEHGNWEEVMQRVIDDIDALRR